MGKLKTEFEVVSAKNLLVGDSLLCEDGRLKKIKSIKISEQQESMYDISLLKDDVFMNEPNFILSNGVVVHNCCVEQIYQCKKLIDKNYPENNLPEDIYLVDVDDPKVYEFINTLKLDNVFQMESRLFTDAVGKIKPQTLQDISNISTLVRPGAACSVADYSSTHMDPYKTPQCLHDVYKHTRGWMLYQEQLLQVLMKLGGFSIFEADKVRRLVRKIGKSKTSEENRNTMLDDTKKYEKKYLKHAIKTITEQDKWSTEEAKKYSQRQWDNLMGQARYCLEENEPIVLANGIRKKIKHIKIGDEVLAFTNGEFKAIPVVQKHNNGIQEVFEATTNKGKIIRVTGNHKFLTKEGKKTLLEIWEKDLEILEKSDFD